MPKADNVINARNAVIKSTAKPGSMKKQALRLYLEGSGFRSIGRLLGVSNVSVLNWIRKFGKETQELNLESKETGTVEVPEVLSSSDITDASVSTDAVDTRTGTASRITDGGGHYLLSVKGNQKGLPEDAKCAFKADQGRHLTEDIECNHGRTETHRCCILPAKGILSKEHLPA
ncbi:Transposase [Bacteroidales bacterium Barb6XT]|nr:Transposase [Bacteroidales bacterium Barb6XT]